MSQLTKSARGFAADWRQVRAGIHPLDDLEFRSIRSSRPTARMVACQCSKQVSRPAFQCSVTHSARSTRYFA